MKALGEWVLIEPKKVESMLNDKVTYENEGRVISAGEMISTLKEGDIVHFRGKSDLMFEIQGDKIFKVKYGDIVCIL